jgi:hypothetical protein
MIRKNERSIPRVLTDLGIADGNPDEALLTDGVGNFSFGAVVAEEAQRIFFNANAGEAISKGDPLYISGISGSKPVVMIADASDPSKMPAFGIAGTAASLSSNVPVVTFGTLNNLDTATPLWNLGDTLYVGSGVLQNTKPSGESSLIQNLGKVQRVDVSAGSIKVGGAGRTNDTPNLNEGNIFIGDATNCQVTASLATEVGNVVDTASWLTFVERVNIPEAPGDTVEYVGWSPYDCTIESVSVYSDVVNTQGTLTLDVENVSASASCLTAPVNMNSLSSQTVTAATLVSAPSATLTFSANDIWRISLVSNDVNMDGSGFYILVSFKRTI